MSQGLSCTDAHIAKAPIKETGMFGFVFFPAILGYP
jgi:hypothetical protein